MDDVDDDQCVFYVKYYNYITIVALLIFLLFCNYHSRRYSRSTDETAPTFSQKRCLAWFREYTTPDDPDTLGPEGMEKFCEDIGVEPENVVMLVLAYRMQARQMGFFSNEEWLRGLSEMQCDSIQKLQSRLDYLRCLLNDQNIFKAIYRYAYDFARVSPQTKYLKLLYVQGVRFTSLQVFS